MTAIEAHRASRFAVFLEQRADDAATIGRVLGAYATAASYTAPYAGPMLTDSMLHEHRAEFLRKEAGRIRDFIGNSLEQNNA